MFKKKSMFSIVGLLFASVGLATMYVTEPGDGPTIADIGDLLKKQSDAFAEFKTANDKKIAEIEAAGKASKTTLDEIEKLNATINKLTGELKTATERMDEIEKKGNRPGAGDGQSQEAAEHKQAFDKFVRTGNDSGLSDLEAKAMNISNDPNGGFFVPHETEMGIDRVASVVSAVRSVCDVKTIGAKSIKMRVKTSGSGARWVGEGEAGGESSTPTYAVVEINAEELEAEPWIYNSTLEDADVDLESEVTEEAGIAFGETEGLGAISGNGVKKMRGFLAYEAVPNASWVWGKLGYIASGDAAGFAASNPADKLITLIHSLKATYRNGAVLLMNDTTLGLIRQIKDGSGNYYLFNPDATGKFGGFILGVPVVIDDNMPDVAANSFPIAYGNFKRGYRIVDRKGISLIRDSITEKGTVKFNFRKRVGGGIRHFEAIKLFKIAVS